MKPVSTTIISEILKSASEKFLNTLQNDTSAVDARVLLQYCLKKPHSYLLTWPEKELNKSQIDVFSTLLQRRLSGEPVAYIIGFREFWSMDLKVTPDTLIPRPETELLVELAIERLSDEKLKVLDMGTGSGAIALAIASEKPNAEVLASDISKAALKVARDNAQSFKLANVDFIQSDWGKNIPPQKFEMIVSNPPYIEKNDPHLEQGDLRFEPDIALSASSHGLSDIKTVIDFAKERLVFGGHVLMEHGYNQHQEVSKLLTDSGFSEVQSWQDISGHYRVSGAVLK